MARTTIDISWTTFWRIFIMTVLFLGLFLMRETVAILLLALVISTALDPAVDRLERWRVPRILGTIIIFLLALTVLAFVLYTILPVTLLQLNSLFKDLTGIANQFLGLNSPLKVVNLIDTDLQGLTNVLLSGSVPFLQVLGRLLGGVAFAIAVLVLSFYLTIGRDGVEKFLRAILPESLENRTVQLYKRTRKKIGRWFQAQLLLSLMVGSLVFFGLLVLGVEQNLVLAVIAGVLELVPVVGPIFAGALAFIAVVGESFKLGILVLLLFLVIQQLENQVFVPLVMKRAVGINPVIILVALLGGAQVAGIIGMLVAIPVAVFLQEVLNDWVAVKSKRSQKKLKV